MDFLDTVRENYIRLNQNVAAAVAPDEPLGDSDEDPFCCFQIQKKLRRTLEELLGLLGLAFESPDPTFYDALCEKEISFARLVLQDRSLALLQVQRYAMASGTGLARAFNSLQLTFKDQADEICFFSRGTIDPIFKVWTKDLWKTFDDVQFFDGPTLELFESEASPAARAYKLKALLSLPADIAPAQAPPPQAGVEPVESNPPPAEPTVILEPLGNPEITNHELGLLEELLANQAGAAPDWRQFYRYLIEKTDVDKRWEREARGHIDGDLGVVAQRLLRWAQTKGSNPRNPEFTVLGSLLMALLPKLGLEEASTVVAVLTSHGLVYADSARRRLASSYQVPWVVKSGPGVDLGPDFAWHGGPEDDPQLQGFLRDKPDLLDVGFLSRAIQNAASVCRIEVGATGKIGTGFIIGRRDRVLTNFHVLTQDAAGTGSIEPTAGSVCMRFGAFTSASGKEEEGRLYKVDNDEPLLGSSPTNQLDYALLKVDKKILDAQDLNPAQVEEEPPLMNSGLHLLQHALGEAMKLAIGSEGVTGSYEKRLVQYVSRSAVGSSGSPCFNDDWKVVALHHAERSKAFGSVCEGILMKPILDQIKAHL